MGRDVFALAFAAVIGWKQQPQVVVLLADGSMRLGSDAMTLVSSVATVTEF